MYRLAQIVSHTQSGFWPFNRMCRGANMPPRLVLRQHFLRKFDASVIETLAFACYVQHACHASARSEPSNVAWEAIILPLGKGFNILKVFSRGETICLGKDETHEMKVLPGSASVAHYHWIAMHHPAEVAWVFTQLASLQERTFCHQR